MKNLLFLFTLLLFVACKKQEIMHPDSDPMDLRMTSSNVNLLGLDKVPLYPNDEAIRDLLKNPDDASDEDMSHLIYDLSEAVKPLITDYGFNSTVMMLARKNGENTMSFADLKATAPAYYKRIDANLAPSSIARIEQQMIYVDPSGGKGEQYIPGIHIPNLKLADANRQPLLSAQFEYIGKDDRLEEFILCTYHNAEGNFESTWVGPHTADVSSNPIFVIDNLQKSKKGSRPKSIDTDTNNPLSFREGLNVSDASTSDLQKVSTDIEYYIKQYKIAHRYDKSRHSEYKYRFLRHKSDGSFNSSGGAIKIRRIHKNNINHLYYGNEHLWTLNSFNDNMVGVSFVAFEHDWWSSNKTAWVGGFGVSMRTKYSSHWYQKFYFDYNGTDQSQSSKGYIKLESDAPCTTCPPGYGYDGANCYSGMQAPPGYNIFIWGTSFYVQQNCSISTANNCCPQDFGWDTANCHSGIQIPTGWSPFVWNRGFYVQPSCE